MRQTQLLDDALIDLLTHRPLRHPLNKHPQHHIVRIGVLPLRPRLKLRRLAQRTVKDISRGDIVLSVLKDICRTEKCLLEVR